MKAFGSPSMRSSSLECFPKDDLFSTEVKNRIFFPDIGSSFLKYKSLGEGRVVVVVISSSRWQVTRKVIRN